MSGPSLQGAPPPLTAYPPQPPPPVIPSGSGGAVIAGPKPVFIPGPPVPQPGGGNAYYAVTTAQAAPLQHSASMTSAVTVATVVNDSSRPSSVASTPATPVIGTNGQIPTAQIQGQPFYPRIPAYYQQGNPQIGVPGRLPRPRGPLPPQPQMVYQDYRQPYMPQPPPQYANNYAVPHYTQSGGGTEFVYNAGSGYVAAYPSGPSSTTSSHYSHRGRGGGRGGRSTGGRNRGGGRHDSNASRGSDKPPPPMSVSSDATQDEYQEVVSEGIPVVAHNPSFQMQSGPYGMVQPFYQQGYPYVPQGLIIQQGGPQPQEYAYYTHPQYQQPLMPQPTGYNPNIQGMQMQHMYPMQQPEAVPAPPIDDACTMLEAIKLLNPVQDSEDATNAGQGPPASDVEARGGSLPPLQHDQQFERDGQNPPFEVPQQHPPEPTSGPEGALPIQQQHPKADQISNPQSQPQQRLSEPPTTTRTTGGRNQRRPEQAHYQPPSRRERNDSWRSQASSVAGSARNQPKRYQQPVQPQESFSPDTRSPATSAPPLDPPQQLPPRESTPPPPPEPAEDKASLAKTTSTEPESSMPAVPMIGGIPLVAAIPAAAVVVAPPVTEKEFCPYCDSIRKPRRIVTSHWMYAEDGKPACPAFRDDGCRLCGEKGDRAHLQQFCLSYTNRNPENPRFRQLANHLFNLTPEQREALYVKDFGTHPKPEDLMKNETVRPRVELNRKRIFVQSAKFAEEDFKFVTAQLEQDKHFIPPYGPPQAASYQPTTNRYPQGGYDGGRGARQYRGSSSNMSTASSRHGGGGRPPIQGGGGRRDRDRDSRGPRQSMGSVSSDRGGGGFRSDHHRRGGGGGGGPRGGGGGYEQRRGGGRYGGGAG